MQHDFLHCYRALGVTPGAGWAQVKAAYRAKVRASHPDRVVGDDEQKRQAEERTKTINKAYKQLADFYHRHGALPLTDDVRDDTPGHPGPSPRSNSARGTSHWKSSEQTRRFIRARPVAISVAIAMLTLVAAYLFIDSIAPSADIEMPRSGIAVTQSPSSDTLPTMPEQRATYYFTYGSTLGEVYAAQGVPTRTEGDIWHYGASKIYFSHGKVVRWEETKEHPLRAQLDTPIARTTEPGYFRRGSTKSEVRNAQGTPMHETERVWDYGVSRVYFDGDRVVGWSESPLNPLKVK